MFVDFNILNQLGSPSINSNTFANRPAAGQTGRLFVSTDTYEIYRDNGTTWDLIGGPGSSTVTGTGAATQVAYWTAAQAIGGSNNLWWDNTNGFLGVGTAAPTTRIEAVKTDGIGIYANFTTNAGSGSGTTGIYSINNTASSGYAAVIEERTPNTTGGQYPLLVKHSLSAGTAAVGMGTGLQFQLPDDAGTFKTTQLTIETIDAAAATYKTRYRFNVQNNGSSTPVAYINSTGVGVFTATPSAALDIHSTGIIAVLNSTGSTNNGYLAFQRAGAGVWRIGDTYNGGSNFFELHNTVLTTDALQVAAATNKTSWQATETYTTGLARGNYFDFNLSVAAGGSFSSPNAITALGATLDLTLAGNATIPSGARSGLDAYNTISFTGTGTLTHNQGTQIRAYSNVTAGWAFGGSATGTITHLAGLRALFPDNSGSAVNVTNNYALLLNDQTANTGTVTYTNRWGIYQEGASDLNYMAANLLLGSTVNTGEKLQVTGLTKITGATTINAKLSVLTGLIGNDFSFVVQGAPTFSFGSTNGKRLSIISDIGGDANGLQFGYDAIDGTGIIAGSTNALGAGIDFYTYDGFNWGNRMRVTKAGLLGIGTNAPTQTLDVNGGVAVTGTTPLSLQRPVIPTFDGQGAPAITWQFYSTGTTYTVGASIQGLADAAWSSTSAPTSIRFYTVPSGSLSLSERMRISNGGTVLINSTGVDSGYAVTPKLFVAGGSNNSIFAYANASGTYLQINTGAANGNVDLQIDARSGAYPPLTFTLSGSEKARFAANGNFLIGTTTDAGQKLQVSGTGLITGNTTIGNATASTNVEFRLNGVVNKAQRIHFQESGTDKWLLGSGAASENGNFEIYNAGGVASLTIDKTTNLSTFGAAIKTSTPTGGTAAAWKLGSRVAATVVLDTTQYIEIDIGGNAYKLAIVT